MVRSAMRVAVARVVRPACGRGSPVLQTICGGFPDLVRSCEEPDGGNANASGNGPPSRKDKTAATDNVKQKRTEATNQPPSEIQTVS